MVDLVRYRGALAAGLAIAAAFVALDFSARR